MLKLRIQYKIILIVVFILAITLSGIYYYLRNNLINYSYQITQHHLLRELYLIQNYLEKTYQSNLTLEQVDQLADTIGKNLGVRLTILNIDGTVLGDSQVSAKEIPLQENYLYRPEIQEALHQPQPNLVNSLNQSAEIRSDSFIYLAATFGRPEVLGIVRVGGSLSQVSLMTERLKQLLITSFLLAAILAIFFGIGASVFVSKPIEEIASVAQSMASGDFSRRIVIRTNDEIEDLAKAISFMAEQIKSRIDEVTAGHSRLEAVFLSMIDGVMVVDVHGEIVLMNQALRDFLKVTEEPVGRKPLEVIRNIEIQNIADKVLTMKSGVESRELSVLLPKEKELLIHATPVLQNKEVQGAVLMFHEITELRRLEKIRREFVANVSHELRTPVATIKGYAETLLDGALEDKANAKDFVHIIFTDAQRLAKLVNDLLDLSKIESGKMELEFEELDLEPIVDRVISALASQSREEKIKIIKRVPVDLPKAKIDETAIAQVLLNLVENGIKYNKPSGSVTISAKEEGSFIKVMVSDTGIGIPEEDISRIFERFYRVDKARSRQLGGTGLGLSIVKHLIQSHNGYLNVESELGKGSTFSFFIPKA